MLSYGSLCDQRFRLSTFPPTCTCHDLWLASERAVVLPLWAELWPFSGLFGKGLKVLLIELAVFQLVGLQNVF